MAPWLGQLSIALYSWSIFTFMAVLVADWHEELFALVTGLFHPRD